MKICSIKNSSEISIDTKNSLHHINLHVKITTNTKDLSQAKQLLFNQLNIKKQHQLPSKQQKISADNVLFDGYDKYAEHLIVKEPVENKVVAYIRIIDSMTACHIGGFYCETQFNLQKFCFHTPSAIELSHLVIAPEYNNQNTLDILWSKIKQYADERNITTIFGTLSMKIENCHYTAIRELNYLKSNYLSASKYQVKPHHILPPTRAVAGNNFELPAVVNYLFSRGAKLCGDASWNSILNHAELFFYIQPKTKTQLPLYLRQNKVNTKKLVA